MPEEKESKKNEILQQGLEDAKKLAAEIKDRLHDAGDEAKEQWEKLSPKLKAAEERATSKATKVGGKVGSALEGTAEDAIDELKKGFSALRDMVQNKKKNDD